ncbi:MAG: thermonuclease family protein [Sediminimonas qiaohouensis]|uniref:Thermonuclease family protein n=1 Tax=Sediminimonas qiaohouensis TaxID=552061 RepID=A0A7C9HND6_9RHOB|nr:thermonuclease family protein [Sediminimonas qiaohouensis]MTJ05808.1 thermonuclease family protein [Sediminimonas qiaohouensis]
MVFNHTLAPFYLIVACLVVGQPSYAGEWIEGRVTHVRDVDTIEVENRAVRLNGVDGPELDERGGQAAKRWMQRLVMRKPVRCWLNGDRTYDRWVGTCYTKSEEDLGALAISAGQARDCPRYSDGKYASFETDESRRLPIHGYCR